MESAITLVGFNDRRNWIGATIGVCVCPVPEMVAMKDP